MNDHLELGWHVGILIVRCKGGCECNVLTVSASGKRPFNNAFNYIAFEGKERKRKEKGKKKERKRERKDGQ